MRAIGRFLIPAWLTLLTLAVVFLARTRGGDLPATADFQEINVERVNIVEPSGRYRLVLANSARFPGLFMEGVEYKHHSRTAGGLLFFNDEGDEVGGMTFQSRKSEEGHSASAGLMFDQYKQDQTVGLQYQESDGRRMAGLLVWDRPDYSIQPLMEYSARAASAESDQARQAILQEMQEFAMSRGGVGAERMFVGKRREEAIVRLADKQGRPRLVLKVDGDGVPSVEFLDPEGNVIRRILAE